MTQNRVINSKYLQILNSNLGSQLNENRYILFWIYNKILNKLRIILIDMKLNNQIKLLTLILINVAFINLVSIYETNAQSRFKTSDVTITIKGTSTLHDWEMESETADSELLFNNNEEGQPDDIENITFRMKKKTLKSDKSGLDKRAYNALNADRHPEIVFSSNGNGDLQKNGTEYRVNSTGDLTVAGVTRQVSIDAICINGDDTRLICSGTSKLKMSDFDIDPPVMMLGTLRTGDEIVIDYRIVYTK